MAVSTRVGECLGEGDIKRAKSASAVGFIFSLAAGCIISGSIFFARKPLANFYVGSSGSNVASMAIDASPFVVFYYLLNSVTWGLWAIMQGQMRTCFPATVICLGMWCGSVPLAYVAITYKVDEHLGMSPLMVLWACCCLGEGASMSMMALAVLRSNWQAIVKEAKESATIGDSNDSA